MARCPAGWCRPRDPPPQRRAFALPGSVRQRLRDEEGHGALKAAVQGAARRHRAPTTSSCRRVCSSAIEEHVIGIARHGDELLAGQAPPQAGPAALGPAGYRQDAHHPLPREPAARAHGADPARGAGSRTSTAAATLIELCAPGIVVLDDVDYIAEDRTMPSMASRINLYELLESARRRGARRRPAVRPHHQPGRHDRAGRRRLGPAASTRPPRSRRPTTSAGSGCSPSTARASRSRWTTSRSRGRHQAHRGRDGLVLQGAAAPG